MADAKYLTFVARDGSVWGVPVSVVENNHAAFYADEFGSDVEKSLKEHTLPLFDSYESEIFEWAYGNMDWEDFSGREIMIRPAPPLDLAEAWRKAEGRDIVSLPLAQKESGGPGS